MKPPVKEDNIDREKRRASVEKQKFTKDAEKKKDQEEEPRATSAHGTSSQVKVWGESEEDTPDEDDESDDGNDGKDSEGIAARLDRILDDLPRSDVETSRVGLPRGH